MKKYLLLEVIIVIAIIFVACGSSSDLYVAMQEATNTSDEQCEKIEKILSDNDIEYESVQKSENELLNTLAEGNELYDLIDSKGNVNLMILRIEDKGIKCILNLEYKLIYGMLDSSMGVPMPETPKRVPKLKDAT